jgi:hypothetical protein
MASPHGFLLLAAFSQPGADHVQRFSIGSALTLNCVKIVLGEKPKRVGDSVETIVVVDRNSPAQSPNVIGTRRIGFTLRRRTGKTPPNLLTVNRTAANTNGAVHQLNP